MVLLLEVARGLSALWVVLFHLTHLFADSLPLLARFADYGYLGVTMFFVISGYVVTLSAEATLARGDSPVQFLKNRFRRIYPVFWASIAVVILVPFLQELLSWFKTGEYNTPHFFLQTYSLFDWLNLVTLAGVFNAQTYELYKPFWQVNAVYWSLAIEFQFYLVMFAAMYLGRFFKFFMLGFSGVAAAIMFAPLGLNYGLFIHYWPAFAVGIVLAYCTRAGWSFQMGLNLKTFVLPIASLLLIMYLYRQFPPHYNALPMALALGVGAFLWFFSGLESGLQALKRSSNVLVGWFLQCWLMLGAMSYSVYLLHLRVYLLPEMFFRQFLSVGGLAFGVLTLLATLALCYPFYYLVERRFLSSNYQKMHRQVLSWH